MIKKREELKKISEAYQEVISEESTLEQKIKQAAGLKDAIKNKKDDIHSGLGHGSEASQKEDLWRLQKKLQDVNKEIAALKSK